VAYSLLEGPIMSPAVEYLDDPPSPILQSEEGQEKHGAATTSAFKPAIATETVSCPICKSTDFHPVCESGDYEYVLPGRFFVVRCKSCNLFLQNPRPPFPEILRYYTEKYEPFRKVGSNLVQRLRNYVLGRHRTNLYRKLVAPNGSIVDVGCATGALLRDLKEHGTWQLTGVEPVPEVAEMARSTGLNVVTGVLEEANLPSSAFDLAIMNHVLEHVPDPSLVVRQVVRILKPGGRFTGEIPAPVCLERILFGKYWGGYHLPRHLTFFGPSQIKRFLENHGFEEVKTTGCIQPSNWLLSFTNYLKATNSPLIQKGWFSPHNFLLLALSTPFAILLGFLGLCPIIRFSARKPE